MTTATIRHAELETLDLSLIIVGRVNGRLAACIHHRGHYLTLFASNKSHWSTRGDYICMRVESRTHFALSSRVCVRVASIGMAKTSNLRAFFGRQSHVDAQIQSN